MEETNKVYILEAVIEQHYFTDGYGEQALPNYVIVGVYDDFAKAEAEQKRQSEIDAQISDDADTDPTYFIIEEFPVE